jgi:hypothetical protein
VCAQHGLSSIVCYLFVSKATVMHYRRFPASPRLSTDFRTRTQLESLLMPSNSG